MDINKDNKLGKSDLHNLIQSGNLSLRDEMSRLIEEVDIDKDGKIDFNEFMGLLRQKTMSMSRTLKSQT
jgi:Ca2+-binding EF-hand superfamily protein